MGAVAELRSVRRAFSGRPVIDGLDLVVSAGDRVGLAGPNGSGKTTLLRCVAGTLALDGGSITVGDQPAGSIAARRLTGCCLAREHSFYERLTARENLMLFARLRRAREAAAREVDGLVEELELSWLACAPVAEFSAGMRSQLGFARALIGMPSLLLLDESTRSLDDAARGRLWAALGRRTEAAVLISSHRREDLEACDRVVGFG